MLLLMILYKEINYSHWKDDRNQLNILVDIHCISGRGLTWANSAFLLPRNWEFEHDKYKFLTWELWSFCKLTLGLKLHFWVAMLGVVGERSREWYRGNGARCGPEAQSGQRTSRCLLAFQFLFWIRARPTYTACL